MAKAPQSKSERIREYLHSHPQATPKEVADALGDGITNTLVSTVKQKLPKRKASIQTTATHAALVRTAKPLVQLLGGIDETIEWLEEIRSINTGDEG